MSDEILKSLAAAGGHAHISVLGTMTSLPLETLKNYLEMLKKDNKVHFFVQLLVQKIKIVNVCIKRCLLN